MGVTSAPGGEARAATGVRTTNINIASQDHEMVRRREIGVTGQNELGIGARIPETGATDTESVNEGVQMLMVTTHGIPGGNRPTHHYHIGLVLLSHRSYSIHCLFFAV
jgi:hypothetical protein